MWQPTSDSLWERVAAIRTPEELHALGNELCELWGLASFEVLLQRGATQEVVARSGAPLAPYVEESLPAADAEHAGVGEHAGVWSFAIGAGGSAAGWLRVCFAEAPVASVLDQLRQLSGRMRIAAAALADHARILDLERRVAVLADQARHAERLKEEFLSNLSHELRTPLTAILGFSEILLDRNQLSPKQEECVGRIRDNGERLLSLLNRLILLAKLQADRSSAVIAKVDLAEVVREAARPFVSLVEAKGLELYLGVPAAVGAWTDRRLLQEALRCLLENAVKFTDRGSISVGARRIDAERLQITVSDTGRGIAQSDLPLVFDAFWQGDGSMTRAVGGTGIGLALAGRIVQRLGGTIDASSTPGVGSTFTLVLPDRHGEVSRGAAPVVSAGAQQYGLPFA